MTSDILAQLIEFLAELVDDGGGRFVLLRSRGKALALVADDFGLLGSGFSLSWFWNRSDEVRSTAVHQDFGGRLTVLVELPVTTGVLVR